MTIRRGKQVHKNARAKNINREFTLIWFESNVQIQHWWVPTINGYDMWRLKSNNESHGSTTTYFRFKALSAQNQNTRRDAQSPVTCARKAPTKHRTWEYCDWQRHRPISGETRRSNKDTKSSIRPIGKPARAVPSSTRPCSVYFRQYFQHSDGGRGASRR